MEMSALMHRGKTCKGQALTIDALFALLLLLVVIILLSNLSFQPKNERGVYMKLVSLDTLKVLESQGRLSAALQGNTTSVREVFNALPINVCMKLNVFYQGEANVSVAKQDCYGYPNELQVASRGYVYNGRFYTAQLTSWLRS